MRGCMPALSGTLRTAVVSWRCSNRLFAARWILATKYCSGLLRQRCAGLCLGLNDMLLNIPSEVSPGQQRFPSCHVTSELTTAWTVALFKMAVR
jgi:hypothetical protein